MCPVDCKVLSTCGLIETPVMSRIRKSSRSPRTSSEYSADNAGQHTPYEDHADFDGRWSGLTEAELRAAADADPLRFAADHMLASDRREGSVAVILDLGDDLGSSMNVIADAPSRPKQGDCMLLLRAFIDAAERLRAEGLSPSIGLLHHRTGPSHITDVDRRWASAIEELAAGAGITVIGVAARTESGAFVRVHPGNRASTAA